jgi:hypothetical protein
MDLSWLDNILKSIDWATLSNIAVVISVLFIIRQLRETRYTTHAQAYSAAVEILQEEKVRQARKIIFTLMEKPLAKWTKQEIEAAEKVCHTYDVVGQMTRHHLLPKEIIIDSWGSSLRNSWLILSQLVNKYRNDFGATEYWDDYEWLVIEAVKFNNRRQRFNRLITGYYVRLLLNSVKSRFDSNAQKRKARKIIVKSKSKNAG